MHKANASYRNLSANAARAVRLLGTLPARVFDPDVVAAVCNTAHSEAAGVLHELLTAQLVHDPRPDEQRTPGNTPDYSFPDLVGDLAQQQAQQETPRTRREVRRRWVEWYLFATTQAEARLTPSHRTLPRSPTYICDGRDLFEGLPDSSVLAWLQYRPAELRSAVRTAYEEGWWALTWQLVDAMWPLFHRGRHAEDWISIHEDYGLPAAEQDGSLLATRRMLTTLGGGLRSAGRYDEALVYYTRALVGAQRHNHRRDEAQALDGIGTCHQHTGRLSDAICELSESLRIRQEIGYERGVGLSQTRLGEAFAAQGDMHKALDLLIQARQSLKKVPDAHDAARAEALLGRIHVRAGQMTTGRAHLEVAEAEFAEIGALPWQAHVLEWRAEAACEADEAHELYAASLQLYQSVPSPRDVHRLETALELAAEAKRTAERTAPSEAPEQSE
ncbi:tetratricopeptide repeat protein [Streptomyces sp. 8L]|uniref:tetratricopeptide repeat protein n=1 Tax=Streptomyces sp. 8L TaxID=2877242 RepID=UPI001CD40A50|nr:tetratricopeptide repeat protein [Streptomyces sp. 8L]MCA1220052.1 tetratricopeptide repeat protein [Streptomyces sp. 8L]